MSIYKNIENNNPDIHPAKGDRDPIDQKLDELVAFVYDDIDGEKASALKTTLSRTIKEAAGAAEKADDKNEFSILLLSPQCSNHALRRYLQGESISKYVLIALSVVMIVLGLGMIIMPAPPYFEMYTIFYFNQNDGITVMDLMSVIILLSGVYFLVKGIYKNPSLKKYLEK